MHDVKIPYHFTENDIIGRGGMGCVYKGYDPVNGNPVAIKMMSNQVTCYPEYRAMFNSEVEALRKMNHPSIVKIAGEPFKDDHDNLYLPMEYIHGKTIEQYVRANGPFSPDKATRIMVMILDAIQYVHCHEVLGSNGRKYLEGCIHRDIKPSNIMIRDDGSICIIDFGIAKDSGVGSSGKTVGRIIGTDGYMSPEQANGLNIDKRTDIYSLGCVLYYMLTGQQAIAKRENEYETVQAILHSDMPIPSHTSPGVSADLDQVFLKAVDKNMTKRFQTAEEFKQALTGDGSQPTPTLTVPTVTVGSGSDNDIQINNQYVSRHHLVIRGRQITVNDSSNSTSFHSVIDVEDISRNGTGMNGKRLYHSTETIDFTATHDLPQVMLAGRPECTLNWSDITSRLKEQGWNKHVSTPPPPPSPPPVPISDNLAIGWAIISLLFPIIGWVLWGVWKEEYPERASQAAKWAWGGFIINLIIFILFQNS